MDDQKSRPKSYKVILKTGEYAVFTNDNNFDNYSDRLVSGIYSITTASGTTPITPDSMLSIEEVETENDKEIRQVIGKDETGTEWKALIGASIERVDRQGRGKAIKDIRRNDDGKYEVLFYGSESVILDVDENDVLYK